MRRARGALLPALAAAALGACAPRVPTPPPLAEPLDAGVVDSGPAACPEALAASAWLEHPPEEAVRPGTWLPEASPASLGLVPPADELRVTETFRKDIRVSGEPLQVVGLNVPHGVAVAMLRPMEPGFCVVGGWATYFPENASAVSLAASWQPKGEARAILLLKIQVTGRGDRYETRWVALGTDGGKAWMALGTPGRYQLIAPDADLVPREDQLFLEIRGRRPFSFLLDPSGTFVKVRRR